MSDKKKYHNITRCYDVCKPICINRIKNNEIYDIRIYLPPKVWTEWEILPFEVYVIENMLIIGLYFFLKCVPYGPVNNTSALVQLTSYHPNLLYYTFHNFKPQTTFAVSLLLYNTLLTSHNMMSSLLLVVMNANVSWNFLISIINLHLLSRNFSELKLPPPLFHVVILLI